MMSNQQQRRHILDRKASKAALDDLDLTGGKHRSRLKATTPQYVKESCEPEWVEIEEVA
jgi:hypothetical protein